MSNLFPYYPVFLDLAGRAVALLGADGAMAPLARQFLAAGAGVSAFDPAPSAAMRALAPPVRLKLRRWKPTDFAGVALVVAGEAETATQRAKTAAHAARASFHLIGAPELSDVVLGGGVARGALAVGVSAQGAPAALVEAVRGRLEAALPDALADFLAAAARARGQADHLLPDAAARDFFWRVLGEAAFDAGLSGGAAWDDFIAQRLAQAARAPYRDEHSTAPVAPD